MRVFVSLCMWGGRPILHSFYSKARRQQTFEGLIRRANASILTTPASLVIVMKALPAGREQLRALVMAARSTCISLSGSWNLAARVSVVE